MTCCPVCGQVLPPTTAVLFDAEAHTVTANGVTTRLSPTQAKLFGALLAASPRVCRASFLLDCMYDIEADQPAQSVVWVYVSDLRRRLAGTGIAIETEYGAGYRLRLPPARAGLVA